jgi:3-hydroxy-9,10-secoandrosta-1,3,5(10)-triene-9,17-dione monooxygenase reductase component
LSLDPPLILWSIANDTPSFECFRIADPFVVNVLAADQEPLARKFAQSGSDKFSGVQVQAGLKGIPIIEGCVAHLECEVDARHPGGDHDIIIGRVHRVFNLRKAPLLFHGGAFHSLSDQ